MSGHLADILNQIQREAGDNIYADDGKVIQNCLAEERLSKLIVTTIPIILGQGIPLLASSADRVTLKHIKTEVLGVGLVKSSYSIDK